MYIIILSSTMYCRSTFLKVWIQLLLDMDVCVEKAGGRDGMNRFLPSFLSFLTVGTPTQLRTKSSSIVGSVHFLLGFVRPCVFSNWTGRTERKEGRRFFSWRLSSRDTLSVYFSPSSELKVKDICRYWRRKPVNMLVTCVCNVILDRHALGFDTHSGFFPFSMQLRKRSLLACCSITQETWWCIFPLSLSRSQTRIVVL